MKIFQRVRKQYAILGISSANRLTQEWPFSGRVFAGFALFACTIIFQLVYLFHVTDGFMEYIESISSTSGTVIIFVCFAAIVFRQATLFKSIGNIEKLIDTSKPEWNTDCNFSI